MGREMQTKGFAQFPWISVQTTNLREMLSLTLMDPDQGNTLQSTDVDLGDGPLWCHKEYKVCLTLGTPQTDMAMVENKWCHFGIGAPLMFTGGTGF